MPVREVGLIVTGHPTSWLRWRSIARSFGYFFFGLGILLLLLILYAMTVRLLH